MNGDDRFVRLVLLMFVLIALLNFAGLILMAARQ